MSKGRQHFRKTDATRRIKVAMDAGLEVRKVTVDRDGRIEIEAPHRSLSLAEGRSMNQGGVMKLDKLATLIQQRHEAVAASLKEAVSNAIAAGELLLEAKKQVGHGEWLPSAS